MKILIILFINAIIIQAQIMDKIKDLDINNYIINIEKKYYKNEKINFTYNPFSKYEKFVNNLNNKKYKIKLKNKKIYKLFGIFNNQININKKWYNNNDMIDGFYIKKQNMNEVNLIKKNKIIKLKVNDKKIFY
jgi:hypothetical protein